MHPHCFNVVSQQTVDPGQEFVQVFPSQVTLPPSPPPVADTQLLPLLL